MQRTPTPETKGRKLIIKGKLVKRKKKSKKSEEEPVLYITVMTESVELFVLKLM